MMGSRFCWLVWAALSQGHFHLIAEDQSCSLIARDVRHGNTGSHMGLALRIWWRGSRALIACWLQTEGEASFRRPFGGTNIWRSQKRGASTCKIG